MYRRITLLLIVLGIGTFAREPQAPAETIRQVAAYLRRHVALEKRQIAVTAAARAKENMAQWRRNELSRRYDAKRVAQIKQRVESHRERRDRTVAELACARIKGPAERATKLKEAVAAGAAAAEEAQAASAAFKDEFVALAKEEAPVKQVLLELVAKVGRTPEELGVAKASPRASIGSAGLAWHDSKGTAVAYLTFRFRAPTGSSGKKEKLWGRYPVGYDGESSITFSVGTMVASFNPANRAWRGKAKMREMGKALIDLDAISELQAAVEKGDLKRQIADLMARNKDLHARAQTATKLPHALQNASMLKRRELERPYDPSRVAGLERRLEPQERNLLASRTELAAAVIAEPEERKREKEKAVAAAKEALQAVKEAGLSLKTDQIALRRERRYVQFALFEMMDGVARMPKGLGIVDAGVITSPRDASVLPWWSDVHDKKLVRAHLRFRPAPGGTNAEPKVAGKYPVRSWTFKSIRFWAGGVDVELQVEKEEWKNKEKVMELAATLLDLERIAALPVTKDAK